MSASGLLNGSLSLKKKIRFFSRSIKCNFYWISFCWFVFIPFQWKQRAHTWKNTSESRRSVQEIPAALVKTGTGGRRGAHTRHLCCRCRTSYSTNSRDTLAVWVCPTIHEHIDRQTDRSDCSWWELGTFTQRFRWTQKRCVGERKSPAKVPYSQE